MTSPSESFQLARRAFAERPLEERLADVCPGCGQHAVVGDRCSLCGSSKNATAVFVGEVRVR